MIVEKSYHVGRCRPSAKNVRAREPHTGQGGTLTLSLQVHSPCLYTHTGRGIMRAHGWRSTGNALGQARSSVALPHLLGCMH